MTDTCHCRSYNGDDADTPGVPEVVLDPRPVFPFTTKTVCVDACIAEDIKRLWAHSIWTYGCCCGHNGRFPRTVIVDGVNSQRAQALVPDIKVISVGGK